MELSTLQNYPLKRLFFQEDNSMFVLINPSEIESYPGMILECPYDGGASGRDLRKALWVNKKCPELAYMLRSFDIENQWMAQVGVNVKKLEFERYGNGVRMKKDMLDNWDRVEKALLWLSETLFAALPPSPASKFPLDPFWPLPREYKYQWIHPHETAARIAAVRARDAMGVLAARCTLAIALTKTLLPPPPAHYPPSWVQIIMPKVSGNWLTIFQNSFIPDLSPGIRVGAYCSITKDERRLCWIDHLPVMAAVGLPIYIEVPRSEQLFETLLDQPWFQSICSSGQQHYIPAPRRLPNVDPAKVAANSVYGLARTFRWDRLKPRFDFQLAVPQSSEGPLPVPGDAPPAQDAPAVADIPHGKGQRPGESYAEFFKRREERAKDIMAQESDTARAARLEREQANAAFKYPPHKIPIFLWVEVGEIDPNVNPDFLEKDYRQLVGRRKREEIWHQYTVKQKRYDSFHNEWDICPKLCPDDELSDDHSDDEFYAPLTFAPLAQPLMNGPPTATSFVHPTAPPVPSSSHAEQPLPSNSKSRAEGKSSGDMSAPSSVPVAEATEEGEIPTFLMASFGYDLSEFSQADTVNFLPKFDSASELFCQRYGVLPLENPPAEWFENDYTTELLRKSIGYLRSDREDGGVFAVNEAYMICFGAFIDGLLKKPPAIPPAVWDLHPDNEQNILRAGLIHPSLQVTRRELSRNSWYFLRYTNDEVLQLDWELIVPHAATVVTLLRVHNIDNRQEAAEYLVSRGIPFRTIYQPDHRTPMNLRPAPPVTLGWRADSMSLNAYDYTLYERRVYDLLSGPKGRAALLRGGIVWRIAMEVMHGGLVDAAVDGPSQDVFVYGETFRPNKGDDWYDDGLTADEISLICGVYKVCSNAHNTQTSDMSWWPQPHYWDRGTYNNGFWSPWAEGWFLARLSSIRSNEAKLYGSKLWGKNLKSAKIAGQVRDAVEDASVQFLTDQLRVFVVE